LAREASVRGVDLRGVGEDLLDLRQRPVGRLRRVAGQFRPVQAQLPERHHAFGSEQPQHLAEQATQRLLVSAAEQAIVAWSACSPPTITW